MVQKRQFCERSEESSSEFARKTEFKRRHGFPRDASKASNQELGSILEPLIRKWVREAVDSALKSYTTRPARNEETSCESRILELSFEDTLPSTLFTACRVESKDGSPIKVALRDANSMELITSGPLASARVSINVVDGDFDPDQCPDWTETEFNKKTVREREGRRPLVTGTLSLTLRGGIGYIEDIIFTDNSSWIKSGKFRLAVKVQSVTSEIGVREGISNAFKVKDQRGESYKKHYPPSLIDEVWRLEKIAKDGASHKRLYGCGISTVKDFLRLYYTNPSYLRDQLLGGKVSNKAWEIIIGHATTCHIDNDEMYMYRAANGIGLLLNTIYKVVGVIFDGQNYLSLDTLDQSEKRLVETLKQHMHKNLRDIVPVDSRPIHTRSLQVPYFQESTSCSPSSSLQDVNFPFGPCAEIEMQINASPIAISPTQMHGMTDNNKFQAGVTRSAGQIEDGFNPKFGTNIILSDVVMSDPFSGYQTGQYVQDTVISPSPLEPNEPLVVDGNFQIVASPWQGNGFLAFPGNEEELGLFASDFDIHFPSNGKSKVSWCKIRAVVKWRMIKSSCSKNVKASKYRF